MMLYEIPDTDIVMSIGARDIIQENNLWNIIDSLPDSGVKILNPLPGIEIIFDNKLLILRDEY